MFQQSRDPAAILHDCAHRDGVTDEHEIEVLGKACGRSEAEIACAIRQHDEFGSVPRWIREALG